MVARLQNPMFDALYCEEEEEEFLCSQPKLEDLNVIHETPFAVLLDYDFFWEDEELNHLLSKEEIEAHLISDEISYDSSLNILRSDAVSWMLKVIHCYAFDASTAVLAVNYFDRFIASRFFQREKPWMSHLAAVSCLSIAAKVEETQVPLLLDLQIQESKYLFEAKTIQRMELLVLSTLQWKMNPVTPMSFFDHIARRFGFVKNLHWEFLRRCASLILSVIADYKMVHYIPSVIAAATMIYAIREIGDEAAMEYEDQLMILLRTSKDKIDDCLTLILEAMGKRKSCSKRKFDSIPSSPSGVIDAYFSSDNSVDSWTIALSASSSPEPLFKRIKAQDHHQHLRLAPLSSVSVVCLPNPTS